VYILGKDVAKYLNLRIWAERGLIHIEDARDNSYETISVRTALHRANAISEFLGNTRASRRGVMDGHKASQLQDLVDDLIAVIAKAKEQGQPTDPCATADRLRRLPKTVVIPENMPTF
jgi:hypothetical protein